ncbi:MAG TPA: hydroxymethylbilane synthase [Planctomycetota bacterium]
MRLRIGTRGSDLALWQARHVAGRLEDAGARCELVVLETRGDRIDDVPLQSVEGKGFFTKEIEEALLAERIDLAVHSLKDLPSAMTPGLALAAIPARAPAEERLLIAPRAHAPGELFLPLARGARVGTSAPRRTAQLAALRPDLALLPLRGNVPTRVRRLREGRHDAIVLAAAGLERLALELEDLVVLTLPRELLVPAPGQGALAIQTRAGDAELVALCARALHDAPTAATVAAERELLVVLGGGCNLPLGVSIARGARGWQAEAFLGAGHPTPAAPARWCRATGADPAGAGRAAAERLLAGAPTGAGPLEGLCVALTGARDSARELAERLATLGADVRREEVLTVEDLDGHALAPSLARLRAGDALVVTSANAARRLAGLTVPADVLVAAVGPATERALAAAGLRAAQVGRAGAAALARALELAPGARVLFPCAADARRELEQELAPRGVTVERCVLYRTHARADVALALEAEARAYLSPSAVAAALAWERAQAPRARRVALGPATAAALAAAGLAHVQAASTDPEDVLAALVRREETPLS